MRAMKDSGIEWIGEIPGEWKIVRIKHVAILVTGTSTKDEDKHLFSSRNNAYPYISTKDITLETGAIDYDNGMYTPVDDNRFILAPPFSSLLCIEGGSAGRKLAFVDRNVTFVNKLCNFVGNGVERKFLHRYLQSPSFCEEFSLNLSGLIGGVSRGELRNFTFVLPSQAEQTRIAIFLDSKCSKIDRTIELQKTSIEKLKAYKQSVITEAVTKGLNPDVPMKDSGIEWIGEIPAHWSVVKLKYLGTARNGLTYAPDDICEDGILVLRSSNIQNNRLSLIDNVYVNKYIPDDIIVKEYDLLICSRNGSINLIGKCTLIDKETAGNTYGAFMCVYRSRYNRYIYLVFISNIFSYYIGKFLTATINQLTLENLYNIRIPIAMDDAEQNVITDYLNTKCTAVDSTISKKENLIDKLTAYKKSLIYEAVTGKMEI
jgi:type I restriction enzyme S subunit